MVIPVASTQAECCHIIKFKVLKVLIFYDILRRKELVCLLYAININVMMLLGAMTQVADTNALRCTELASTVVERSPV